MLINELKDNFIKIPNKIITDTNISDSALRVYLYIASKPTGWNVFNKDIQKALNIKTNEKMSKIWKELIENGYIERQKVSKGSKLAKEYKIGSYVYIIYANPKKPNSQSSHFSEKPKYGKNQKMYINNKELLNNTEYINNTSPKKQTSTTEKTNKEKNTEESKTEEKKTNSPPNSFSFNLKELTTYNELSEVYKAKLIGKCFFADGDLERFQNFVKALQEKDYKYKDFYRAYLKWDREKKYKNFKPKKIEGDWHEVCQINRERIAVNKKTLEIRKYKVS